MSQFTARRFALVAALLSGIPAGLAAQATNQDNTGYGTSSAEFLLLGAGARGAALGGAFAAIASDVSALYYNPAGTALMARPGAMIAAILFVLWILGFGVFHVAGGLIHLLIVLAVIVFIINLIQGRRAV
jgi:hypothetical protein